ncbi:LIM and calponin homology domains-containing protein 1 isoform X3 [Alligator mississippiensis]|uniref:LIM and calponin homology domains-containing protein 1 isoform X3 n=1 Tax=Alligator mississippiensis TaxID=8496 RepID=UPI00287724F6|nr:LIM and calponin homology domains-containing protein 1 isoform X3 [Alligator mississippiensis]
MASPSAGQQDGPPLQDAVQPEPALAEARRWIEQATGRGFGDKDFRSGLENGILLCELLNAIKPGLVKKINRLSTPIAGLDNIILFLRGCKELGLKESQLFDPGDLQDASNRVTVKNIDYSRKLKNVLVTIYWLGKAANSCTSYNGATLNLREFEGLLAQMRKETEDIESPKRSIRDSGYIDCWDSERSDSLSPPRHGRDDSFDSLDSFGSRSQQTPSPDVVLRGSSDGRGSDSESDLPHRKMPDVKKDDMSARRTSYGEPKSAVPFNQYLPNKSNQTAYIPAPLRKKKAEREEYRKSWSTATSPLGGERPFRGNQIHMTPASQIVTRKQNLFLQCKDNESEEEEQVKMPDIQRDDLTKRKTQSNLSQQQESPMFMKASITQADLETWDRLKMSGETSKEDLVCPPDPESSAKIAAETAVHDDFATCKARAYKKASSPKQRFVHFGPVTEIDQQKWEKLSFARAAASDETEEETGRESAKTEICTESSPSATVCNQKSIGHTAEVSRPQNDPRFGPRTAVSDDAESMSMFDMRCEDEAVMQPHSKARHEKLQNVHNQLKEDETRWQDDLARWKSRRRSASQDLIKKEAERKKMEKLLSGDGASERRKSIKTYREIVEEKERREKELHEAYKNARSHEEAENILQQYIERFTISEAVLEHLQMPKILERSHSVEPNSSSPPKDPNPLKYLRQQSLPAPKYTATIEATIVPTSELEASISTGHMSPSKTVVSKAVPMLTPKPYSQPKNTQQVLKNFKVDGKVSMNGETYNGVEEEKEKEYTTVMFAPSPSKSLKCEGVAREDGHPVELKQDITSIELSLQRPIPHRAHKETTVRAKASLIEETEPANQKCETDSGRPEIMNLENTSPGSDHNQFKATVTCASPALINVEFPPPTQSEDAASKDKDLKKPKREQQKEAEDLVTQEMGKPKTLIQEGSIVFPFLKKLPETSQATLQNSEQQDYFGNGDKSNHFNFWSWDPEEERKRQERWQHEQERLLQERYQKEQDKLKEEWEKAQKEVEEEERRYYEEERKIIEDTVVPFAISSSCTEPLSTSSSITEGSGIMNVTELSNCQEEDKQKEVTRQEKTLWEQDDASSLKNKENDFWQEKKSSINKVLAGHPETILQGESEQDHQVSMMECSSSSRLNLPLTHDASWNQQLLTKQPPHISEEVKQKTPLDQCIGQQTNSKGDMRRTGCFENFRTGQLSPCSPTAQSQSPNRYKRSVSGKKLCSSCGLPLGKGAAMIIETLGLYFHIQCFRCGICKGQLGDAVSGTDVRIRNGLLNCNDCYIRSRTAGQPTTL